MKNVKTNQMNACRCNSEGAGVKMTSWLNNNFKLLALTLLAVLSVNVWGATGDVTVNVAYNDFPDGYASSGTSGSFSKTVSSSNDLTIYYSGVNTKSSATASGYSYGYDMFLKNQGFAYSGAAPTGYYPSRVTVTFSSGTGTSGKAGINFSASSLSSRNSSVTGSVSKRGTCTASNSDQTKVYWNFSTTGANVQVQSMTIVYSKTSAPSCTTTPTVSASLSGTSSTTSSITATVGITNIGGCSITENGLVYSTTNSTPTVGGSGCSKETVTACGSTAANKTVTISGLACGQRYYVCGYATNAAGTRYSNVSQISTSACPVDHFIDNIQETTGYTGDGKAVSTSFEKSSITLSDKDATTSGSCEEVHYHFVGWVTEADRSAGNVDAEHIVNFQDSGNVPTGTTYYAVWAKEAEE